MNIVIFSAEETDKAFQQISSGTSDLAVIKEKKDGIFIHTIITSSEKITKLVEQTIDSLINQKSCRQ